MDSTKPPAIVPSARFASIPRAANFLPRLVITSFLNFLSTSLSGNPNFSAISSCLRTLIISSLSFAVRVLITCFWILSPSTFVNLFNVSNKDAISSSLNLPFLPLPPFAASASTLFTDACDAELVNA